MDGQVAIISNPFATLVEGKNLLSLTIGSGINPVSEKDAGTFIITTYTLIDGNQYRID